MRNVDTRNFFQCLKEKMIKFWEQDGELSYIFLLPIFCEVTSKYFRTDKMHGISITILHRCKRSFNKHLTAQRWFFMLLN